MRRGSGSGTLERQEEAEDGGRGIGWGGKVEDWKNKSRRRVEEEELVGEGRRKTRTTRGGRGWGMRSWLGNTGTTKGGRERGRGYQLFKVEVGKKVEAEEAGRDLVASGRWKNEKTNGGREQVKRSV